MRYLNKLIVGFFTLLILSSCSNSQDRFYGYIEGEYMYVAATTDGILESLPFHRGDDVKPGEVLFSIDKTQLSSMEKAAQSTVEQAEHTLANLTKGKRDAEIQIMLKQKEQADAQFRNASLDYNRAQKLLTSKTMGQAEFDNKEATYRAALARVQEVEAQIAAAKLGAREDEIASAKSNVEAQKEALLRIQKKLEEASPKAKSGSYVADTFFLEGEFVPAGRPVVSLLAPENVKVRFFVPQSILPRISIGKEVSIMCDGCSKPAQATVSYISPKAEYTPPLIYSVDSRQKLSFMIEAKFQTPDPGLKPGLPVDVRT